jgi:hypothetical protein
VILDADAHLRAMRLHGRGELDLEAGVGDEIVGLDEVRCGCPVFNLDRVELDAVGDAAFRSGGRCTGRRAGLATLISADGSAEVMGTGVVAVDVLLEVNPEAGQCVRAVVGVRDRLVVGQHLGRGVDAGVHLVVCFVLPVGRSRRAIR